MAESEEIEISIALLTGTISMVLLASGIIFFVLIYQRKLFNQQKQLQEAEKVYQKDLLNAVVQTQEKERKRIARDLHDEIGAMLSTIKLKVNHGLRTGFTSGTGEEIKLLLNDTIQNTRTISKDLLPITLEKFGLKDAIEELADRINSSKPSLVQFSFKGDTGRMAAQTELGLFRIVQELVNNALKHAEADKIEIALSVQSDLTHLTIRDNGRGTERNGTEPPFETELELGLGLKNVKSRASLLNGKFIYHSYPGKGTCAEVLIK